MEALISIAERFGVSVAMLVVFCLSGWWCLKQLLGQPDGILRQLANKHIQFVDSTIVAMEVVSAKMEESSEIAVKVERSVAKSEASTAALHRAGEHACDVLDAACTKLEIADQTSESRHRIREELHRADQSYIGRDRIVGIGHV